MKQNLSSSKEYDKILPDISKDLDSFISRNPSCSANDLIKEFQQYDFIKAVYVIKYFQNEKFCNFMEQNRYFKFITYIANVIIDFVKQSESQVYLLDILVENIFFVLNEKSQKDLIVKKRLLDLLTDKQIISLLIKVDKERPYSKEYNNLYKMLCSYQRTRMDANGDPQLLFTGKILYLKILCNDLYDEELANLVLLNLAKLLPHEIDTVIFQARDNAFTDNMEFNNLLKMQKTAAEMAEFINVMMSIDTDLDVIKHMINYNNFFVIACNDFQLLRLAIENSNCYVVEVILDKIFKLSFSAVKNNTENVITNYINRLSYNEMYISLVKNNYVKPEKFYPMINKIIETQGNMSYEAQLKALYVILHYKWYQYINNLSMMRSAEMISTLKEYQILVMIFDIELYNFLPQMIKHYKLTQDQIYMIIINSYNYICNQNTPSIFLDNICNSMIIFLNHLSADPLIKSETLENIMQNCFKQHPFNWMKALFYHSINLGHTQHVKQLFAKTFAQVSDEEYKIFLAVDTFKRFWQEKKYVASAEILQQEWVLNNPKIINKVFDTLLNLNVIDNFKYVLQLVMQHQQYLEANIYWLLRKQLYYVPIVYEMIEYNQLLSIISQQYNKFTENILYLFSYETVLNIKDDCMVLTLGYFPDHNILQQWCSYFNQPKGEFYFIDVVTNPKIANFIHSFMHKCLNNLGDVYAIKHCYSALNHNTFNIYQSGFQYNKLLIDVALFINDYKQHFEQQLAIKFNTAIDLLPVELRDWCTVIKGIKYYEKCMPMQV